jgi:pilus assembly protein CpaB
MRAKSLILLVVALGCGMVAAVAVSKAVMDQGGDQAEATIEIFVAAKELKAGEKFTPDSVRQEPWPKSRLPEGAITKMEQLDSKFSNQPVFTGEPILQQKVNASSFSLSTGLTEGFRVFDLPAGLSVGYLKPGDHVDVVGTFKVDASNTSSAEARTVMRDVEVFAINGIMIRDPDGKQTAGPSMLQLKVKESQIEALTLAQKLGDLRVTLRPFGEQSKEPGGAVDNGDAFVHWVQQGGKEQAEAPQVQGSPLAQGSYSEPAPSEEPNEMMIITPNGVTRYQWTTDKELPHIVAETSKSAGPPSGSAGQPGNWPFAGGNVGSGYGGYKPTYPMGDSSPQQTYGNGQSTVENPPKVE